MLALRSVPIRGGSLDDASQWGVYVPSGTAQWTLHNVGSPSQDGNALQMALNGGTPYVNVRAYRNLPADAGATALHLSTSFYYSPSATPVQAIEFLMEKYQGSSLWSWRLQWEHATTGGTWRVYTGSGWQSTGVQQSLTANAWHSLACRPTARWRRHRRPPCSGWSATSETGRCTTSASSATRSRLR